MAAAGVDFISTRIWFGANPGLAYESRSSNRYLTGFPPRAEESQNIRDFVDDVAATGLELDLIFLWLGHADYTVGCVEPMADPSGGCTEPVLGWDNQTLATFGDNVETTISSVLAAFSAGEVRAVYFDGEALYHPDPDSMPAGDLRRQRRNENWFFENHYGYFAKLAAPKTEPTVYFTNTKPPGWPEVRAIDPDGVTWNEGADMAYPEVSGHRTMFWLYRSLRFVWTTFSSKGWPASWKPKRADWSYYLCAKNPAEYALLVAQILDDAEAVLGPEFGLWQYGFTETGYFLDATRRAQACAVMQDQASRLAFFSFWTTPFGTDAADDTPYESMFSHSAIGSIADFSGCL